MGQWIGRGKWVYSSEEKAEYKRKKMQERNRAFNLQVQETKANYLTLSQIRSFLNEKDINMHFSKPDKEISIKFGSMKLYRINRVLRVARKNDLKVNIKKGFHEITNQIVIDAINIMALVQSEQNKLKQRLEDILPAKDDRNHVRPKRNKI
ncbi:hypothetical protein LA345_23270 [Burkholderia vietnamiensis]|nr:hypothetical protein [Burkholderia vietnamiensis]